MEIFAASICALTDEDPQAALYIEKHTNCSAKLSEGTVEQEINSEKLLYSFYFVLP